MGDYQYRSIASAALGRYVKETDDSSPRKELFGRTDEHLWQKVLSGLHGAVLFSLTGR
jgi:hypothetical protein